LNETELMCNGGRVHCPAYLRGCILACERRRFVIAMIALLAVTAAMPAGMAPSAETAKAFDDYVAKVEEQIRGEEGAVESFLALPPGGTAAWETALRRGEVLVEQRAPTPAKIPGGLIHHWVGTVFIPNATVAQVLAIVQDYDHLTRSYAPEVMASRLISREGDDFRILLRMRKQKVVTVVLDAEYQVHYGRLDAAHQFSASRSTRISEIADAGSPREHAVADAENHGYLWRLNSYWRFVQATDGAIVQCEAISLTRNAPTGLGWLIGPFVREIPRESLEATLGATRDAVAARVRVDHSTQAEQR
jgi:hypothetical protein